MKEANQVVIPNNIVISVTSMVITLGAIAYAKANNHNTTTAAVIGGTAGTIIGTLLIKN